MHEAWELVRQGGGWSITVVGMGAVLTSLILLVVFIKVFAAIIRAVERRGERREEAARAAPSAPQEPTSSPEGAVAAAIALANGERQEELVAAVSYAIHNYLSGEAEAYAFPPAAAGEGEGSNPWSMAGRMRLMNDRTRLMDRVHRG